MVEFDFYCTYQEWRSILDAVLRENRLRCALDTWYPSAHCPLYTQADDALMKKVSPENRRVYLLGDFTTNGVPFSRADDGPRAGWYSIKPSRLGPLIDFSLPTWFEEEGIWRIVSGSLDHPSEFWNNESMECYPASSEVRAAYAGVKLTLKRWLVKVDLTAPTWVSRPALELAQQCKATLLINGHWVCGRPGELRIEKRPP